MMDIINQLAAVLACIVVVVRTEPAINRMDPSVPLLLRLAFWCLCVAALGAVAEVVAGQVPPWPATLGAAGVALLLICERRIRYLTRPPKGRHDAAQKM